MKQNIQDVMTPLPHSVGLDQHVDVAQTLLQKYQIRHLPVLDGGVVVGIVSERDIQFALSWSDTPPKLLPIADVMTPDPYLVDGNEPLAKVAKKMAVERIGCAVIVEDDMLKGIFTTVDACRILAELLE